MVTRYFQRAQGLRLIGMEHDEMIADGRRLMHVEEHRKVVEAGGGVYVGTQAGEPSLRVKELVLFNGPSMSTIALPPASLSAYSVRKAIEDKEAEFASSRGAR